MRSVILSAAIASLLAVTGAGAQPSHGREAKRDTARVVFVCEHGSVKSIIAAAMFNRLAAERGLAARAVSRGTVPDSQIPRLVRDGLREDGADIGDVRPVGLSAADARRARMFVTFDVDLPSGIGGAVPVRRWDHTPSVMSAYPAGRDAIATRVAELIAELQKSTAKRKPG